MDWTSIIIALAGIISGGGIIEFFHWRSSKRKAEAEASQAENTSESIAVETLEKALNVVSEQMDSLRTIHTEDVETIESLHKEINDLNNDLVLCSVGFCANGTCPLRKPCKGMGQRYIESHKEDGELFDNRTFDKVLEEEGYIIERNGRLQETETEDTEMGGRI